MSYLSLLFTSAVQGMTNASRMIRQTEAEAYASLDALEKVPSGMGSEPEDYRLPLGIASLEHWLDLNA